jgi:ribonuclease P protein component
VDKDKAEKFPHNVRIVRSSEYRALYKAGKKIHSERFVLFCRANNFGHLRLGITVSRKVGGAVVRNRVKRILREVFRRSLNQTPIQIDIVFNAKSGCAGVSYAELQVELLAAINKIYK